MAVLISGNADISWAASLPSAQLIQLMSNGHYLVIYLDLGTAVLMYRTSGDGGATWSAGNFLPGSPTEVDLCSISVVDDVLYMWYAGLPVQLYSVPYNTSTNLLETETIYAYSLSGTGATGVPLIDVTYADGAWHIAASVTFSSRRSVAVFRTPGSDGTLATSAQFLDLNYAHTGLGVIRCEAVSGFLHVSWFDTSRLVIQFAPVVRTALSYSYSAANLELAGTFTDPSALFSLVQDNDGTQTFVVADNNLLYAIARQGTDTYSLPIALQSQIASGQSPSAIVNGSDVYVGFQTEVNRSTGETYLVKREGSIWELPVVLAGGTAAGFTVPVLGLNVALYQDLSANVYFTAWSLFGAPLAPTGLAPTGDITTLTPDVTWNSNPSAPGDATLAHQVQVYRISDNNLMDDSGSVAGAATDYVVPGGAALAYNVAYGFQVRERDSLSALGAGTWGPYSALAVFTPRQAATVTIATVTSGGVTTGVFPATIGATDIQAHVTWTSPDAHAGNAYRMTVYAADNTTVLATSPTMTITPSVASGSAFDTMDWTPGVILNSHTYFLGVEVADASTGVFSPSGHRQLNASYAAPPSPSGLTATPDPDEGTVTLTWTNPAEAVSTIVEWQPYTETGVALGWLQLGEDGHKWNHLITTNQAPQLKADYRVTVINSLGIKSAPTTVSGVYLDNALDYAGVWVNDVNDPVNRKVYIGYIDNYDSLKRTRTYQMEEWVPMGAVLPVQLFGIASYWQIGTSNSMKIFLPGQEIDSSGNVRYGADNRDMAISLANSHDVLTYRDRRFPVPVYVKLMSYEDQPYEDVNTEMTLELHATAYFAPLPVIGSLV